MTPAVILCVMVGFSVIVGLVVVMLMRPAMIAKRTAAFETLCEQVGLEPLRGPSEIFVACGGEVRGVRMMVTRVETRSVNTPLPPRLDIVAEAGLTLPIASGGVFIRPGSSPRMNGTEDAQRMLQAALTPELLAAVESRLGGRFAFSSWDTLTADAASRTLVKSRWPDDWSGLRIQTWVDLDAKPATIQAAMDGLVDVRDVLARSPGVTERAR